MVGIPRNLPPGPLDSQGSTLAAGGLVVGTLDVLENLPELLEPVEKTTEPIPSNGVAIEIPPEGDEPFGPHLTTVGARTWGNMYLPTCHPP